MKRFLYQLILISFLSIICLPVFSQSAAKRLKAKPKGSTSLDYGYYEYLPANYNSSGKLPLVIFFHGIAEKGNGTSDLHKVIRVGPGSLMKKGKDFPFIYMSPQSKGGWWTTSGIQKLINHAKKTYKVDPSRIYITGLSAGGFGTWIAGQTLGDQVAAIVPICGCGDKNQAAKLKNVPVWAFHNSGDAVIKVKCSTDMVNAIKSKGGKPKLTIYNRKAHDAWSRAYRDQNMWNWLLSQRKGKAPSNPPAVVPDKKPLVDAGSDRTLILPKNSLAITASASDRDGSVKSYKWTKVSGPAAKMANTNKRELKLSSLKKGTYVFRITVKDNKNLSSSDDVKVFVNSKPAANKAPIVNAGNDKTLTLPSNKTSLAANYSDKDGKIVYVKWTKLKGPSVTMGNTSKNVLQLSKLVQGTYTFRITVKDNKNATRHDDVKVVVLKKKPTKNIAPTVYAGADQVVTLPKNSLTLHARTDDKDGKVIYTLWTKVSGPSVKMVDYSQAKMHLSKLVAGTYVFRITVMDNVMGSNRGKAVDEVRVIVKKSNPEFLDVVDKDPSKNISPTVNAGPDKVVTLPVKSLALNANCDDKDGQVIYTLWTKVSGPSVKMTSHEQRKMYISNLVPGTYVFKITVMDDVLGKYRGAAVDYVKVTVKKPNSSKRLGVSEADGLNASISVFPNPTPDKFYLELDSPEKAEANITVLNNSGSIVKRLETTIGEGEKPEINLEGQPEGIYFVKVSTGDKHTTLRLVKN